MRINLSVKTFHTRERLRSIDLSGHCSSGISGIAYGGFRKHLSLNASPIRMKFGLRAEWRGARDPALAGNGGRIDDVLDLRRVRFALRIFVMLFVPETKGRTLEEIEMSWKR